MWGRMQEVRCFSRGESGWCARQTTSYTHIHIQTRALLQARPLQFRALCQQKIKSSGNIFNVHTFKKIYMNTSECKHLFWGVKLVGTLKASAGTPGCILTFKFTYLYLLNIFHITRAELLLHIPLQSCFSTCLITSKASMFVHVHIFCYFQLT